MYIYIYIFIYNYTVLQNPNNKWNCTMGFRQHVIETYKIQYGVPMTFEQARLKIKSKNQKNTKKSKPITPPRSF